MPHRPSSDDEPPSAPDPLCGKPYRIVRRLGEGGMGEVYEVEHKSLGSRMVCKILRRELADDAALADRVRVEAQALGALSHPNVVRVTDFSSTADGRPFYVMERLDGRTLGDELRRRGRLPLGEAVDYVRQALRGLAAAHAVGLVHRDIKLANLFLHAGGDGGRTLKVLDFGVAKVLAGSRGPKPPSLPTADGAVVGTPRYVSPEQVLGRRIDGRADVYAMGLVLYALIAGRGPWDDLKTPAELFDAQLSQSPAPPSRFASEQLPDDLEAAILKALRKDPAERFQSAAEFERVLASIARALPSARAVPAPEQAGSRSQHDTRDRRRIAFDETEPIAAVTPFDTQPAPQSATEVLPAAAAQAPEHAGTPSTHTALGPRQEAAPKPTPDGEALEVPRVPTLASSGTSLRACLIAAATALAAATLLLFAFGPDRSFGKLAIVIASSGAAATAAGTLAGLRARGSARRHSEIRHEDASAGKF